MTVQDLADKLKSFEIPLMRRDLSQFENILWLGRNLAANNSENPLFKEVCNELKKLRKKGMKEWLNFETERSKLKI